MTYWIVLNRRDSTERYFGPFSSRTTAEQTVSTILSKLDKVDFTYIGTLHEIAQREFLSTSTCRALVSDEDANLYWESYEKDNDVASVVVLDCFGKNEIHISDKTFRFSRLEFHLDRLAGSEETKNVIRAEIRDYLSERGIVFE